MRVFPCSNCRYGVWLFVIRAVRSVHLRETIVVEFKKFFEVFIPIGLPLIFLLVVYLVLYFKRRKLKWAGRTRHVTLHTYDLLKHKYNAIEDWSSIFGMLSYFVASFLFLLTYPPWYGFFIGIFMAEVHRVRTKKKQRQVKRSPTTSMSPDSVT